MTATRSFGFVFGASMVLGLVWGRAAAQDQAPRASPDSQGTDAAVEAPAAQRPTPLPRFQPFIPTTGGPNTVAVELDRTVWNQVRAYRGVSVLEGFRLRPALTVDLEVKRFHVTRPDTRFVVHRQGADVALDFDPSLVTLLRGKASGYARSHVVLAVSPHSATGYVDLGEGEPLYQVRSGEVAAGGAAVEQLEVFPGTIGGGPVPDVPFCGFDELQDGTPPPEPTGDRGLVWGMLQLELAVDTDYEFFELFGDLDAAAAYVVTLYGVVSDLYMGEVNTRIELSFVRLWDTPDDPFNEEDPFWWFSAYWYLFMDHVHRDAAQLLTGRRDLPYGGVAWLGGVCSMWSQYSVAGYILGYFAGPDRPSTANWDIFVTAHELGHNCGAPHTHDLGIDDCDDGEYRRGTIMSYCHHGAGGQANIDSRFHTQIQIDIEEYLGGANCVVPDCNLNGIDDALDVAAGTSLDANANGIPDECEDCNTNGVLDDADIAGPTSQDVNGNGIPDECEPDCNSNGVPDEWDITLGTSDDLYSDNVPDECAADCNSNGQPDYDELQAEMSLDINRDVVLDACEDCDGDGIADLDALAGAHHLWVQSAGSSVGVQCHPETGVPLRSSFGGPMRGFDLIVGPNGHLLSSKGWSVKQFDELTGAFLGYFVHSGEGGLEAARGLALTAEGHVLVSSMETDSVLEYDSDGSFVGEFVTPGLGGLSSPYGLTFGPMGNLFVCSDGNNQVIEYDGQTGAFVRVFVSSGSGGLGGPRGLTFMPDGHLLVAGVHSDALHKYHRQTGESLGIFNGPAGNPPTLVEPWGVRIGPNGNVFVARSRYDSEPRVIEYDARSGRYVRLFVRGTEAQLLGLSGPTGLVFLPGWDVDCNFNLIPDECDLAAGTSADTDGNGILDECEVDCNTNGVPDRLELCPHGSSFDCNANFVPDECDLRGGTSQDCDSNGVPDECDLATGTHQDCNDNAVPDKCDLAAGTSTDCNTNGVPDECESDADCNGNGIQDFCDLALGTSADCNANSIPDECDIAAGTSQDCDVDVIPDECEPDCNANDIADDCDIATGTSADADSSGIPDECEAPVLYVHQTATGGNHGATWADAYNDLQSALRIAPAPGMAVTEIWVAAGTYRPDGGSGDRNLSFELISGLGLYGGFAGGETDLAQRDPAANLTVLSADLNGDDGPGFVNNGENSHHVITAAGTDATAVLDGFIVTGGNADSVDFPHYNGGGILNDDGGPTITQCIIAGNSATTGGGLYNDEGTPTLINCVVAGNRATTTGGGFYNTGTNAHLALDQCALSGNTASSDGGGLYSIGGGADVTLTNCSLARNTAGAHGGGVRSFYAGVTTLTNCVLWANTDGGPTDQSAQIKVDGTTAAAVNYTCIQYLTGGLGGTGNISGDPWFIDPDGPDNLIGTADDNLRRAAGSACTDAGDNAAATQTTDADDRPRFVDDPMAPDIGAGTPPLVDMGPYEYQDDCNTNGIIDSVDLDAGTSEDCNTNRVPDECETDCNLNGFPDDCDIVAGTSADCQPNGVPDECEPGCNGNGIPDDCDIAAGTSLDCQPNGVPDECETDCNENEIPDDCDIAAGTSTDCQANGIPDECELADNDCNSNGIPDECEPDCNANQMPDACDIRDCDPEDVDCQDCNENGVPDWCDIEFETSADCNDNGIPDDCDIAAGTSLDCQPNGVPDECESDTDCNGNGIQDFCDLALGTSTDCQANGIPDECELADNDCNSNGIPDECDIRDCPMLPAVCGDSVCEEPETHATCPEDCPPPCEHSITMWDSYGDGWNGCTIDVYVDGEAVLSGVTIATGSGPEYAYFDAETGSEIFVDFTCVSWCSEPSYCVYGGSGGQLGCAQGGYGEGDGDLTVTGDCGGGGSRGVDPDCADCNANQMPDACDLAAGTSVDCQGNGIPDECEEEPVTCGDLDLKPGSCPNSFNRGSHGVLPVALMGSEFFNLSQVDISSIRLSRVGEPEPCEHCITMWDDYGDGWNGYYYDSYLDVYVDGELVLAGVTLASGTGPETVCFEADAGSTIQTVFTPGYWWPYECSYCIYDGFGDELGCDGLGGAVPTGITVPGSCPRDLVGEVAPHEGPPGPHTVFADTATPFDEAVECECADLNGDGIDDLSMEFKTDDVVPGLELDGLPAGALVPLVITGQMIGGGASFTTPTDCLRLVPPGTGGALLTVEASLPGVWVDVSPPDLTLDTGGFADFQRTFPLTTVVTLTAEEWAQGRPLRGWQIGGLLHHMGQTSVEFAIDQDMAVRAVYGPTPSGGTKPPGEMAPDEMVPEPIQGQSVESGTIDRR